MHPLPRVKIAHTPTSLVPMPRLSAELGGPNLWIKRDDQTGLAFGGNKTRKLEFLLAQAQANGAQTLITAGAVQSNHCRQTAAAAAKFGLDCILVLSGDQPDRPSGNLLLDMLLGAEIVWTDRENRDGLLKDTFDKAWQDGKRPYMIPYGGSNPYGAAGYVFAVKELVDQCVDSNLNIYIPDWIIFPSSSGGTQAGLVAGVHIFPTPSKILGISVDEPAAILQQRVADLATQTADLLGEDLTFKAEEILVNDEYTGEGYGMMGEVEKEAIRLFAKTEGIMLDPVYTGRAAGGMIDLIRRGLFGKDENVLFWHTGGTPAIFADRYLSVLET